MPVQQQHAIDRAIREVKRAEHQAYEHHLHLAMNDLRAAGPRIVVSHTAMDNNFDEVTLQPRSYETQQSAIKAQKLYRLGPE